MNMYRSVTSMAAVLVLLMSVAPQIANAQTANQVCLLGECNAMTTQFRDLTLRPKTIALLMPQASLHQKNVLSTDEKVGEARALEEALVADLQSAFEKQDYEVRVVSGSDVDADPELSQLVLQANARYDKELDRLIASKLKGVKYRRYTVDAEARILANYLGVDAVVFSRLDAIGASTGQSIIGFGNQGQINLGFSIAHAQTGDIEAFFGANYTPAFGKSIKKIIENPGKYTAKIVKTSFKKMPKLDKALKPEKLDQSEIRALVLHDADEGDDVLGDLEDMLELAPAGNDVPAEAAE